MDSAMMHIDTGDTAWLMISAALVLLMLPGIAFFYGGLVRKKNILSILMQCFTTLCIVSLQWVLFGYSLAFGPDRHGTIGSFAFAGLRYVGAMPNVDYSATVPHLAFAMFQCMFAVITPALILGAYAERMKFSAFCLFTLLWSTFVYDPIAHWVWAAGGFLKLGGALDFAGGTVVHVSAGVAALVAALVLGKRRGSHMASPHNLPFAVLGAALLWFGWFGFNAGSALGANAIAVNAFMTTHVAAAAAGLSWSLLDWVFNKRPTLLGMITGAVAGLVAITPAAGFVNVFGALGIGIGAAVLCYFAVAVIKGRLGYDDSLDAFGVHGIGGIWGAIATGLWATRSVNESGANGLFYGNPMQLAIQIKTTLATLLYSLAATYLILKLLDITIGLRVDELDERIGLDMTQHRESAYTLLD